MLAAVPDFRRPSFRKVNDTSRFKLAKECSVSYDNAFLSRRSLINCLTNDHVPMPLRAVRLYRALVLNRGSKCVKLWRKLVYHGKFSLHPAAPDLSTEPALFVERKCRRKTNPTLRSLDVQER